MGADALHHLSIDIETYSDVDIGKAGLYKYAQSPAFQILLFAYSLDGAPVQVVDFTKDGPKLPPSIWYHLADPGTLKHAYNAAFEWYCLRDLVAEYMGMHGYTHKHWLSQWRCTMLHGMYLGYPGGLDACGKALGLPQDKQKMGVGKSLIRYFCVPCKPTKANGGRTRNLPHHDPAKWELFKTYNGQDVVTEMEIESRLANFPVPDEVQKQWELDLTINARGVAVDRALVASAQAMDAQVRQEYIQEAQGLTGLENPNSVAQLTSWLTEQTGEELPDLSKGTVAQLLKSDLPEGSTRRLLEIRQELGKTSNKKYDSLAVATCEDGRVRGLLQFYGANRTGRWCLTGDHEVLTPSGWVRLDQWQGGKIACWAPSTEYISFQSADPVSFPYDGEMYRITGQRCEQICTPDHKMAVLQKDGTWAAQTMESLNMHRFTMPFTGKRLTNPCRSGTELRVLIMTQADGHYTETGDVRYHFKKARKIERCKRLLRSSGISFIVSEYTNGVASVVIKSRFVPVWLRQFRDKTFGWWLLDEDAEVIFDELQYWDAYNCGPNSKQYVSTRKQNVDVLQALAILSGRSATALTKDRQNEKWNTAYVLNIWNTPGHGTSIRREQISKEPFSGTVYCASTKTGYFLVRRNGKIWVTGNSGRLVQPQNLPRTYIHGDLLPMARDLVKAGNAAALKWIFGSVPDTLSQLIRTALVASPGNKLLDADFSAIEARVIAWLADEEWVLEVFRTHGKIYEATASQMFNIPIEKIKKGQPEYAYRQKGKVATLALGYQGGVGAMRTMDTGHELDSLSDDEVQELVDLWRKANPKIVELWGWVESAARAAVVESRTSFLPHGITIRREIDSAKDLDFMTIRLPSGRWLYYPQPAITKNRFGRPSISYMGQNQTTKKWERIETYGGKLVENIVQAVARDCLAEAITRLEAAGYPVVFHIHDEIVVDAPEERKNLSRMEHIMSVVPDWAPGLPLNADGWVNEFFKKD